MRLDTVATAALQKDLCHPGDVGHTRSPCLHGSSPDLGIPSIGLPAAQSSSRQGSGSLRRDHHCHIRKARHFPTARAEKMGVALLVPSSGIPLTELKPPDMIAQLHSGKDAGLAQFDQIAVDRRPVKPTVVEGICHFRMRLRTTMLDEMLKHRQPGRGAPQARRPHAFAERCSWCRRSGCRQIGGHLRILLDRGFWQRSQAAG